MLLGMYRRDSGSVRVLGPDPLQSEVVLRAMRQAADEGRKVLLSSHIMAERRSTVCARP
ncbi:hypothetical protein [Actinomyces trachealis]|uniref:hypothetical protein n=1 Tax=Actinomyces trachealis TaxID=2763540 RepID=UPI003CC8269B